MPFQNKMQAIAADVVGRYDSLVELETELKASLAETQQQKAELESAVERARSLLNGNVELPQNPCISCYIFHERLSSMTPIASETGVDMFRCHSCGDELQL